MTRKECIAKYRKKCREHDIKPYPISEDDNYLDVINSHKFCSEIFVNFLIEELLTEDQYELQDKGR